MMRQQIRFAAAWIAAVIAVLAGALTPNPADAHLSIIRQGAESVGTAEAGDGHGSAVAAGDFNGDGFDDLAMGAPFENVNAVVDAGFVTVEYGTPLGVTHVGAVAITEADAGGADQANAEFGYALATGDFNNDGFVDLAIGAPGSDANVGNADAGAVHIMRGSPSGLTAWTEIDQSDAGGGREAGDRLGTSLAVGDFDLDGYDDLAAGSPGEDSGAGAVFYVLGAANGLPNGGSGWFKQSTLGGDDESGDAFGASLAAGNIIGTSYVDLAVGAPNEDVSTFSANAGQVWVVRGASTGLSVTNPKAYSAGVHDATQSSANFGFALAIGRFSSAASGFDGLAIGEPGRDFGAADRTGRVVVVEGASAGLDSASAFDIYQTDAGGANASNDEFGSALCAGTFEEASAVYDDLAIGSPGERFSGAWPDAGNFYVFAGGFNGPTGAYGWASFNQGTCNDPVETGDEFGEAICFGRFDNTNKGTFAVGAPGEDSDAGMVHVIAPWRQIYGLSSTQSIVYDCEESLVFSVKPFDQVWIANTTMAMTCLIAAERAQLPPGNPNYLDLDEAIVIPAWIDDAIPGPLQTRERIALRNLMYISMMVSSHDAAHAIAYFIYGGEPENCVTQFVAEMNTRAAALGMADTHFNNPAGYDAEAVGYDLGEHYSTPEDMATLSRAAMNNSLLSEVAGTPSRTIVRNLPFPPDTWVPMAFTVNNVFLMSLGNALESATGIKDGSSPNAKKTGLFAAQSSAGGTAIAGLYGLAQTTFDFVDDAARLLQLGIGQCGDAIEIVTGELFVQQFSSLSSGLDQRVGGGAQWGTPTNPDQLAATFDLFRVSGQGATSADLTLRRIAELDFASNQSVIFGIAPFQRHEDIRVTNMGATAVTLEGTYGWGQPPDPVLVLAPGESGIIPAFANPAQLPDMRLTLRNTTGQPAAGLPAHVTIEEAYAFDLDAIGNPGGAVFSAEVRREGPLVGDSFEFFFTGQDAVNGSAFNMIVHDPGALTGVGDPGDVAPGDAAAAPLRLLAASPNPFTTETRIGFALSRPGQVGVKIYDVQGRLVRALDETRFETGNASIAWDGREAGGRRVAPGVFFYRVDLDGQTAGSGKLVTLSR